ncbi:hypothetical protein ACFL5V_11810 [Fibrobacterota bacterium]
MFKTAPSGTNTIMMAAFRFVSLLCLGTAFFFACEIHDPEKIEVMPRAETLLWMDTQCSEQGQYDSVTSLETLYFALTGPETLQTSQFDSQYILASDTLITAFTRFDTAQCKTREIQGVIKWLNQDKTQGDTMSRLMDSSEFISRSDYDLSDTSLIPLSIDTFLVSEILYGDTSYDTSLARDTSLGAVSYWIVPSEDTLNLFLENSINQHDTVTGTLLRQTFEYTGYVLSERPETLLVVIDADSMPEKVTDIITGTAFSLQLVSYHEPSLPLLATVWPSAPDSINASLVYPETLLAIIEVPDTGFEVRVLDASEWPGNFSRDTAAGIYSLMFDSSHSDTGRGWVIENGSGRIRVIGSRGDVYQLPFNVSKTYSGFYPAGSPLESYWSAPSDPAKFLGDASMFTLSTQIPASAPVYDDSVTISRSLFQLAGDFSFDIHMNLPGNILSGYTLALFLSEDTEPDFWNLLPSILEGFEVFSPWSAGISFNGRRNGFEEVKSFAFGETFSLPREIPNDVVFRFERTGGSFSFLYKNTGDDEFSAIRNTEENPDAEGDLYLYIALGNYYGSLTNISINCDNFIIRKGELLFP